MIQKVKEHIGFHYSFDRNTAFYFDSFETEYIPQKLWNKVRVNQLLTIYLEQKIMMCGFYCIAFVEYMLAEKILLDYTNLFSANYYKSNNKIIYDI